MEVAKDRGVLVKVVSATAANLESRLNALLRITDRGVSAIDGFDVMIIGIEPTDRYVYIYYTRVGVAIG